MPYPSCAPICSCSDPCMCRLLAVVNVLLGVLALLLPFALPPAACGGWPWKMQQRYLYTLLDIDTLHTND